MVGRNRFFFRTANEPFSLGGGLEAWKGFYSSVRPSHNQLMVNVNGQLIYLHFCRRLLKISDDSLYNCILHSGELGECDLGIRKFIFRCEGRSICSWCQSEDHTSWLQENNQDSLQYECPTI